MMLVRTFGAARASAAGASGAPPSRTGSRHPRARGGSRPRPRRARWRASPRAALRLRVGLAGSGVRPRHRQLVGQPRDPTGLRVGGGRTDRGVDVVVVPVRPVEPQAPARHWPRARRDRRCSPLQPRRTAPTRRQSSCSSGSTSGVAEPDEVAEAVGPGTVLVTVAVAVGPATVAVAVTVVVAVAVTVLVAFTILTILTGKRWILPVAAPLDANRLPTVTSTTVITETTEPKAVSPAFACDPVGAGLPTMHDGVARRGPSALSPVWAWVPVRRALRAVPPRSDVERAEGGQSRLGVGPVRGGFRTMLATAAVGHAGVPPRQFASTGSSPRLGGESRRPRR